MEGESNNDIPKKVSRRGFLGIGKRAGAAIVAAAVVGKVKRSQSDDQPPPQIDRIQVQNFPTTTSEPKVEEDDKKVNHLLELSKIIVGDRKNLSQVMNVHRENILSRFGDRSIPEVMQEYLDVIEKESEKRGINPASIIGIIGVESQGDPKSHGRYDPNDVGLLQQQTGNISPFLKKGENAYNPKRGEKLLTDDVRFDPNKAIRLGTEYLEWAKKYVTGNREDLAVLSFYIGPGNVSRLIENNMPSPHESYYLWMRSPKTLAKLEVAGLYQDYLNYPLLVLAAAELAAE